MAEGYYNSKKVNATLCLIECECGGVENDNPTNVIGVSVKPVLITSDNGTLYIDCALEDEMVVVYTANGVLVDETAIENGYAIVHTGLERGSVVIVNIGEKSVKVIVD